MADLNKFVQLQRLSLYGSGISATDTSIVLESMLVPTTTTTVTMTDFGSIGYGTLEPGTEREENISFTGITQNANGTATLTGVTRGLNFISPYTTSASLKHAHAGGTGLYVSNSAPFYNEILAKDNDETITGVYTFTSTAMPKLDIYAAPTATTEFAPKKYVDDIASGGTATIDRLVPAAVAGETVVAGNLIYFDLTDNEWKLTDADTAATVDNVLLGIAQGAGTDGNPILGGVLLAGLDSNQSGMVQGDVMYAGNTAGAISSAAGTTEVTVGIAKSATELYFAPRFNQNITEAQQDLLDGITASASEINNLDGYTGDVNDLNEMEVFFGATDITGAEAETLSNGSNADLLHSHPMFMGVGARLPKSYLNFNLPYDDINAGLNIWVSSACTPTTLTKTASVTSIPIGDNPNYLISANIFQFTSGGAALMFNSGKDVFAEFAHRRGGTGSEQMGFGITSGAAVLSDYDDQTVDAACFTVDAAGALYGHTSSAGVGHTETPITGVTLTNLNVFRIEFNGGTDVKFYVNGVLKATNTTNLPAGATAIKIGYGGSGNTGNNGDYTSTVPSFAVEI